MRPLALHPYQKKMVQHTLDHDKCALFAEMGLGKSLTILEALHNMPGPVLIVAPLRVVENVWRQEAEKFSYDYTFSSILGTPAQRRRALKESANIHLINVDNLVWLRKEYDPKWPFKTVIFDESSLYKTNGSKRSRAALWIANRSVNVVLLSGTPSPQGLLDLHHQVKMLDGGKRLGRSKEKMIRDHFRPDNPFSDYPKWEVLAGHDAKITDAISDICMSLTSDDYLTLPDTIVTDVVVSLDDKVMQGYEELVDEMFLELQDTEIDADSAGVLVGKLAQYASGAVYIDKKLENHELIHNAKLEALDEIIQGNPGQQILVAYNYRHSRKRIFDLYPEAGDVRGADAVDAWNEGRLPIMTLHPASGGHGLNLQAGGHILVWFDMPWSLENYAQANARLDRQGKEHPTFFYRLMAKGTIDNDIAARLESKASIQSMLMEALK